MALSNVFRIFAVALMAVGLLLAAGPVRAAAETAAAAAEPLPDYVIEKFGQPPAIPA